MTGRARRVLAGFTLVELLVVMALLSLVMLAMVSAMRTAAQTEERVDARLQRLDDFRIASDLLRTVLGRVSAEKKVVMLGPNDAPFFFAGESGSLYWIGIMPARYGLGGRYHLQLTLTSAQELVLHYAPLSAEPAPDWSAGSSVLLLSGVTALAFGYEDAAVEPPVWTPAWSFADKMPVRLPDRVMISMETLGGPLPEIVIPLRQTPLSGTGSGGPSFGGGGR